MRGPEGDDERGGEAMIAWEISLEAALERARAERRPVLLDFGKDP